MKNKKRIIPLIIIGFYIIFLFYYVIHYIHFFNGYVYIILKSLELILLILFIVSNFSNDKITKYSIFLLVVNRLISLILYFSIYNFINFILFGLISLNYYLLNYKKNKKLNIIGIISFLLLGFCLIIDVEIEFSNFIFSNIINYFLESRFDYVLSFGLFILNLVISSDIKSNKKVYNESLYMDLVTHALLMTFTFGVYKSIWIHKITTGLNRYSKEYRNPTSKLLLCSFVPFYYVYWLYKSACIIDEYSLVNNIGIEKLSSNILAFCFFFKRVTSVILQDRINFLEYSSVKNFNKNEKGKLFKGDNMNFINEIKERAKLKNKTIVLPETMDERVVKAASIITNEKIASIILVGNENEVKSKFPNVNLDGCKFVDPFTSELTSDLENKLYDLRKEKGMTLEEAHRLLTTDFMYYACMLVKIGMADGVVSGACHSTANTLRPSLQIIKTKPGSALVSAFFLMVVPDCEYGSNGTFVFADSGLVQNPNSEELAAIAESSAKSFELLVQKDAYVAMLSHSTKGSASHADVDKVVEAVKIAKEKFPNMNVDGELQLDAAIVPSVAESKAPGSNVAGKANVLVFPDLDAGNIGYKLVQRLGKAEAYGPITQGINKPINDLSRGCSVDDIVGVVAITVVQCE